MYKVPHWQGLATGHMYAYTVVDGPLQCDEVVKGSLWGEALTVHLGVIGTTQSLLTTQGCNKSVPETGHKEWVTIREHTFGHAMVGYNCCNEQLCNALCCGSALAWHKVSILCQATYKVTEGIIAL